MTTNTRENINLHPRPIPPIHPPHHQSELAVGEIDAMLFYES